MKSHHFLSLSSLFLCALSLGAVGVGMVGAIPSAYAAPPSEDYQLVWSDEFDGTELDLTKWIHQHEGKPRRDAINSAESVSLDGKGNLLLTTFKRDGNYFVGFLASNYSFRYGYTECRVQMQKVPGYWSAFWMMPNKMKTFDTPNPGEGGVEMDIYEYLCKEKDSLKQNLHWNGYKDGFHKHVGKTQNWPGLGEGFHVIGMEWTPEECVFYVDGKETWRSSAAVAHVDSYLKLTCEVGAWGGKMEEYKDQLPDSVIFDYVRVYQKK
ncbi:MAG: glycoside hydrolase family 16 protein [Planctomycetia bacterium]|nr:glycoside hydrolase family 16 protein [Planctomycetia bacterium]